MNSAYARAEKIYAETEGIAEEEGAWLVIYDFHGIKPSTKYWTNLKRRARLESEGDPWQTLKREIDEAITDIRRGVGVDFRERLRATMH